MNIPLRWSTVDGACIVELSPVVLEHAIRLADELHPLENGASLYGRYSSDQRAAFIVGLAPVSRDATRGRFHFRRGVAGLAAFFRRLFRQTKGESYYVGEFHSHPGGAANPSADDDATQYAIAADDDSQCQAPVLIIVGGVPGDRTLGVFVHTRARRRFVLRGGNRKAPSEENT